MAEHMTESGATCETRCHAYGIGCACSNRAAIRDAIRPAAVVAVHNLEAREADPSVAQYVDAVLDVIYAPTKPGADQ